MRLSIRTAFRIAWRETPLPGAYIIEPEQLYDAWL